MAPGGVHPPCLEGCCCCVVQRLEGGDHSGYDPSPALAALQVPTLWLLGSNDRTVPTHVCAEILDGMKEPNFTVRMLPTGHGLLLAVRFPADE
ncbi:MAG: hypothetical protein AUG06_08025 [Actinobacteria bacterium 13_1_20CM_2_65_11]|nr:MAG: hypothetical protein AUH69_08765 [Actinobacteria bacterium 13_1_40CM_4_65_12]OLE79330.1 MAG: hypothetical protein AUG06_08025 [Actinobacteria bacterium 13_1_20CM_2_65_11]